MEREQLLEIAADWSFWDKAPPKSVARDVGLPEELRPDRVLVVQGVRRCGKSTLLQQLMRHYGLERERCLHVNFEDPRLAGSLSTTTLDLLVKSFDAQVGGPGTYFLDEIQWVPDWQRWIRAQVDRPRGRRFVVTGSNAHLLSGELGSTLTGRHFTVELFPYSLQEFRRARPGSTLEDYLVRGGFPAATNSPDRDRMLRGYMQDIVERDVRERVAARSSVPLRQLAQMLFESAGSELSLRRAAAALGVSTDTAGLYVEAIESAYLALSCPYFAWSMRKRLVRQVKYFPIDTGLRRVSVTSTGADRGKLLEMAVFLTLRRRFGAVHYWRGAGEVDFVVEVEGRPVPVQVTWEEPLERHEKALDEFLAEHRNAAEPVIVTARSFERGLRELKLPE
jgi:predicted AAA+ superfamily ATPase